MIAVYLLDVPENRPVADVAARTSGVSVGKCGPYFELRSERAITIDRRSTGCRHAVWYSCVAGVAAGRITHWDKDRLHIDGVAATQPSAHA